MTRVFLLLCLFLWSGMVHAANMDMAAFGRLPILHEGRIKPIASIAVLQYKAMHDSAWIDNDTAVSFMADALFDPAAAAEEKTIAVRNPHTRTALGLNDKDKYVSLTALIEPLLKRDKDMATWLQADPKSLNSDQADLLRLYDMTVGATQMLRTFTPVLPLSVQLPEALAKRYGVPANNLAYLDFIDVEEHLNTDLKKLLKEKGDDIARYTKDEQTLAYLSYQLQEVRTAGAGNGMMRLIPTGWNAIWQSPWDMLLLGEGSPEAMKTLNLWREASDAYRANDASGFNAAVAKIAARMGHEPGVSGWRLALEQFYMNSHPITLSLSFYALALALWLGGRFAWAGRTIFLAAFVHGASIAMRVTIMERPPVGTLFESALFVGFIAVLAALWLCRALPGKTGIMLAALLGLGLQLTTLGFVQNGDTLQTLQAVLNTPFWLATHVIIITAGYGLCLLLALLAHMELWLRAQNADTKLLQTRMQVTAIIALLLTAVGTILGGLWADQSWGRFWGWDPKENGALLIVLWLSWIMHGRLSGDIKGSAYAAGCAFLSVIVAIAWFGVNLLSTGLHSYGFISGVAGSLAAYVLAQSALVAFLWRRAHKKATTL